MASSAFELIEAKLSRAAAGNRVRVDETMVPVLGTINRLVGVGGLKITKAEVEVGVDDDATPEVTVSGRFTLMKMPAEASLHVVDGAPLEVTWESTINEEVSLVETVSGFSGPISALASRLLDLTGARAAGADIALSGATVAASTVGERVSLSGETSAPVTLRLADAELHLKLQIDLTSKLDDDGSGTRVSDLRARGALDIGPAEVAVEADLAAEGNVLTGTWSAGEDDEQLGLLDLFEATGLPVPEVPDELLISLSSVELVWDAKARELSIDAASDGFGSVSILATKTDAGRWVHTIAFNLEEGTSPADLPVIGPDLGSLDEFTFEQLSVVYASRDGAPALLPSGSETAPPRLEQGINAVAVLDLYGGDDDADPASSGNGRLAEMVGTRRLSVVASAATGAGVMLRAELEGSIELGGGLALADSYAQLTTAPFGVGIAGSLRADLGEQVLVAEGGVSIDMTQVNGRLIARAETHDGQPANMLEPLGIRGVGLSELGLGVGLIFTPPSASLGIQAAFSLGDDQQPDANEFALVLQVIPSVPIPAVNVLVAQFALEELSLNRMLMVFVEDAPELPGIIGDIEARNLGFHYASKPTPLPDGSVAQTGFGFHGELDMFGMQARAIVMVDPVSGARGRFEMAPLDIRLGSLPVLKVSRSLTPLPELQSGGGVGGGGLVPLPDANSNPAFANGPVFEFNSAGPRYLFANCEIELFGLYRATVLAEVNQDGLTFLYRTAISDVLSITMTCSLSTGETPRFRAKSSFDFDLDIEVPMQIGELDLGTFELDTALHLSLEIDASLDSFALTIDGDFEFEGLKLDFPRLTLAVPLASFADLGQTIIDHLLAMAGDLFAEFFASIEELWNETVAVLGEAAEAVGEAVVALAEEAEELAEDIVAGAERAVAAVGEGLEEAGKAVAELADDAAQVAEAGLEAVAEVTEEIEEFAVAVGAEIEAVGEAAVELAGAIVDEAEAFVAEVGQQIEAMAREVERAVEAVIDDAVEIANAAVEAAKELANDIAAEAERLAAALEREFAALARELTDVLNEIARWAEQALDDVGDAFEDAGEALFGWI